MLKIYNTLSREKEDFIPINEDQVTFYVCGPTVYNYIHIGNARSAVAFDTIRRYLIYRGYNVRFVSNFTDVDDKMIDRADQDQISVYELADKFINKYNEDTKKVNILPPTVRTRATDFISEIIEFISSLIKKDVAYEVDGNVYFKTRKFKDYGKLSDQKISDLLIGASEHVTVEELKQKQDPLDFALWKKQRGTEISWDSPFGKGRPGWHIECSVMSMKELGSTIDLHGGGVDLTFPHHENEIAQSESKTGKKFVNYWLHNGFVTINNEKMSKSLGNFVTLHEALDNFSGNFLRFFLVQTNYRKPLIYSDDHIEQAKINYERIMTSFRNLVDYEKSILNKDPQEVDLSPLISKFESGFIEAMDDDFNVQNALSVVYDYIRWFNKDIIGKVSDLKTIKQIESILVSWLDVLGVEPEEGQKINDPEIIELIHKRDQARSNKDFALSDQIRDELMKKGITIEDTSEGTRYYPHD